MTVAAAEGWLSGGGAPATDWRGERAGELERLLAHQKVPEVGVGVARSGLSAAARARRRRVVAGGGGPVRESGRGGAEETQGTKGFRFNGLTGEVEVRGGGSTAAGERRRQWRERGGGMPKLGSVERFVRPRVEGIARKRARG